MPFNLDTGSHQDKQYFLALTGSRSEHRIQSTEFLFYHNADETILNYCSNNTKFSLGELGTFAHFRVTCISVGNFHQNKNRIILGTLDKT